MHSTQNPTAANCSQPRKQPKIQMDFTQNPTAANCSQPPNSPWSRWILHKTLLLQTVHNLPSSPTGPAEFATKHRPRKLFTTFPASQGTAEFSAKTYLCKLFTTPTFSQSPAGLSTTPCPGKQYKTDQTNPYPASCFQPPQKPKVKAEQYIHPTVQAVKVVRSSLNQQCLGF